MAERMDPNKAISGTFGECWIDGEKYAEIYGLKANWAILKEDVPVCGSRNGRGKKVMGAEGTGSVQFTKVNSKLHKKISDMYKSGNVQPMEFVSKLADPAVSGAERVSLSGVIVDNLPIVNWNANSVVSEDISFTYDDYEYLDVIE